METTTLNKKSDEMSSNILRRIANNHQVSFKIEAMSWNPIGGGKCSDTCKVIEVIKTLEQCEEREKGECPYYAG